VSVGTTVVLEGLHFGEGPRWHDGRLWFSDFYDRAVKAMDPDGSVEVALTLDDQPSGLGWLPDGRLLVVSMVDRRVLRVEADGTVAVHADLAALAPFHCNDMVVDGRGRAYVGNFGFDLHAYTKARAAGIRPAGGAPSTVLLRVDPDGSARVAADDLRFPNGAVITPDGRTLVVGESLGRRLTAFDIQADGSITGRRVWADLGGRVPDGSCLDAAGRIWVANPVASECVLVAEGGEVVQVVETTQPCIACALGGDERRTLYCLTAPTSDPDVVSAGRHAKVEQVRVDVPGAGWP
jgi:sugar lactone lactonase YvrE